MREVQHPAKSTPHLSWLAAYDNCRNVDGRPCLLDFPLTWRYFSGVMGVERFTMTEKVSTNVTAVVGQVIDITFPCSRTTMALFTQPNLLFFPFHVQDTAT